MNKDRLSYLSNLLGVFCCEYELELTQIEIDNIVNIIKIINKKNKEGE